MDKDGTLYLGGVGGMIYFHPGSLANQLETSRFQIVSISKTDRRSGKTISSLKAYHQNGRLIGVEPAIRLILGNLISNALKFTEPGKRICIRFKKEGPLAVLEVEDEGIGMEKTQLIKLRENTTPATTKGTEGERGTGLGLSLCRALVQLHQGRLLIRSRKGKGTLVRVELPMP